MEDNTSINKKAHKLILNNRRCGNLTGVSDVLSFDENEIILETDQGMLMMKGKELHVSRLMLDKGEVDIDGRIDSVTYSEQGSRTERTESFLGRLFK
jgi:sporulation protein YabP